MKEEKRLNLTRGLFLVYVFALTWIILFKMQIRLSDIAKMELRNINLIPLGDSAIVNGRIDLSEILLNIAAFIHYGIYISMLKEDWNFILKALIPCLTSLAYETVQYIFAIGASDITDLIGNTAGGLIGIVCYWLLSKLLKENRIKVINILALIGTIGTVLLMAILIVANLK